MRSKTINTLLILSALLTFLATGCSPDHPGHPTDWTGPTGASALTSYVAIGNSLTAGFMDGGLIINGQLNSYPRLIAGQMGLNIATDSSDFAQPYIASPGIGSTTTGVPADQVAGVLHWDGASIGLLGLTPLADIQSKLLARTVPTPYNNLGVPGATSRDALNALDSATSSPVGNSYFDFILRNGPDRANGVSFMASSSQIHQGFVRGGTLTTVWIGSNDALGGAMSGNPILGVNVSTPAFFSEQFTAAMGTLRGGAMTVYGFLPNIVCANIPSITSIPFFVPEALFNQVFQGLTGGQTPIYMETDVGYVTFPTISMIAGLVGVPIPGTQTLTTSEVAVVEEAIDGYNFAIAEYGEANGVPVVDMHQALIDLKQENPMAATHFLFLIQPAPLGPGLTPEQAAATTYFSLDGVHPNNIGYGYVANIWLETINATLGSSIPAVDLSGLVWDPTYGATKSAADESQPWMSPEAVAALEGMFRF